MHTRAYFKTHLAVPMLRFQSLLLICTPQHHYCAMCTYDILKVLCIPKQCYCVVCSYDIVKVFRIPQQVSMIIHISNNNINCTLLCPRDNAKVLCTPQQGYYKKGFNISAISLQYNL